MTEENFDPRALYNLKPKPGCGKCQELANALAQVHEVRLDLAKQLDEARQAPALELEDDWTTFDHYDEETTNE